MKGHRTTACFLVVCCLWVCSCTASAVDGFPIVVARDSAPIKLGSKVLGTAKQGMLLWAFRITDDGHWARVKVPGNDSVGWISVNDAIQLEIPAAQQTRWNQHSDYYTEWTRLIEEAQPAAAAKTAADAAENMNAILKDTLGFVYPGYPPAATALNQAGVAMVQAGQLDTALQYFLDAATIAEAALGSLHPDTCIHRANAADLQVQQGQFDSAIRAFDVCLPVLESDDSAANSLETYFLRYGTALAARQRIFDARIAFEKARSVVVKTFGARSLEAAHVATLFAAALEQAGVRQEAIREVRSALLAYRELVDPEHPSLLETLNRLSAYNIRLKDYAEAKRYAEESVNTQRNMVKPQPFQMASALNNLGLCLARLHDFSQSEQVLNEAIEQLQQVSGEESLAATYPQKNLAILAMEQQDYAKAKDLLQQVLETRRKISGGNHPSIAETLTLLGQIAIEQSNREEAKSFLLEAVAIREQALGIDHPDSRRLIQFIRQSVSDNAALLDQVETLVQSGRMRMRNEVLQTRLEASHQLAPVAQEYRLQRVLAGRLTTSPSVEFHALEITSENAAVQTGGPVPVRLAKGTIVYAHRAEGDRALIKIPGVDQLGWVRESSVRETVFSDDVQAQLEAAQSTLDEGWKDNTSGEFESAIRKIRQGLNVFEQLLGEDSAFTASARSTLGTVLASAGESRVAVEECTAAVSVLEETLGPNHAETAMARNNLANALLVLGRPAEALRPAALALQTMSGFGDEQKASQAIVAGNVGMALGSLSHYEAAREYLEYALKRSIEAHGENHTDIATCYNNLGQLHEALHDPSSAQQAFEKALRISQKVNGPTHPGTADSMVSLGEAMVASHQISAGRKLIEAAADINLKQRGPMDLSTIYADHARARLALRVGAFAEAETINRDVIDRASTKLGSDNPTVLAYRSVQVEILFGSEKYEEALTEADDISRMLIDQLGPRNHKAIRSINAIGACSAALGRLDVARVNYERAYRLSQQVLGPEHPDTNAHLFNIGEVALMAKDYIAARPRMEAALEGFRNSAANIGADQCTVETMLGYIDVDQKDLPGAVNHFDLAARHSFDLMQNFLPALSEREQLAFLEGHFRDMFDAWLSLPLNSAGNQSVLDATAVWLLNMKGASQEVLARKTRQAQITGGVENRQRLAELTEVRSQLARLSMRSVPPDARKAHDDALTRLAQKEEQLARELGDTSENAGPNRSWLNLSTVREGIPSKSLLISFARIRNANYVYSSERTRWKGDRYLAWIIPPAGPQDVVVVDLGLADGIDAAIQAMHDVLKPERVLATTAEIGESQATEQADKAMSALAEQILRPLLPYCDNCDELLLSPDSLLWTVPWPALPTSENDMLIDRFQTRLLISGRDCLKQPTREKETTPQPPLIVAHPRFDLLPQLANLNEPSESQLRSVPSRFVDSFADIKPLPGTAAEAMAIRESVQEFSGAQPEVLLQEQATEETVKATKSPHCLVLSTHGFFFPAAKKRQAASSRNSSSVVSENPLLRCGLLLTGCQHAADTSVGQDDGILTGLEITGLNLADTELVVLSACETGLGDLRDGEGVAGLRQAFHLAGADSVVATLWQVEDEETSRLMDAFFKNLASGQSRAEALRQAQLQRVDSRRQRHGAAHPFYWAAFTLTGLN